MRKISFAISMLIVFSCTANNTSLINEPTKNDEKVTTGTWENDLIYLKSLNDSLDVAFIWNESIFNERWDTLAQPQFWKKIMFLSEDSCIINIAKTRTIIAQMSLDEWDSKTTIEKDYYRDSVRKSYNLAQDDKIYVTTGKSDFYSFDLVFPTIAKGVEVFRTQNVDPWYAQAILMIESPGKLAKSNAGAYGAFQLMPGVARSHGLTVNRSIDERKDFVKSAKAASSLIANTCLPHAREILDEQAICYNETDLWFRLFVLHVYHAGAGNVKTAIKTINPTEGGSQLIQTLWQTTAGNFRNASQNYSQLALAALLIFDEMMWSFCDYELNREG